MPRSPSEQKLLKSAPAHTVLKINYCVVVKSYIGAHLQCIYISILTRGKNTHKLNLFGKMRQDRLSP